MYGPNLAISGSIVHINCTQLEGRPPADLYITTPQGVVIPDYKISIIAAVNDTGNYTCTANTSLILITEEHYLLVYGEYAVTVRYWDMYEAARHIKQVQIWIAVIIITLCTINCLSC